MRVMHRSAPQKGQGTGSRIYEPELKEVHDYWWRAEVLMQQFFFTVRLMDKHSKSLTEVIDEKI